MTRARVATSSGRIAAYREFGGAVAIKAERPACYIRAILDVCVLIATASLV